MQERQIETGVGTLAVFELGDGPPVFLWPSLYADHVSLLPVITELARSRRCVVVDPPGHGRSSLAPRRYTLDDCARAALQIFDALGIDRADWIGNAWGGHVGVCVAATSARLRSLTVIGSPMEALSPAMRRKTRMAMALLALGARDLVGKLVAQVMVSPASAAHRDYVRACIREAPRGGIRQAVQSISLGREDLTPVLARITVPTLFVAGAEDPIWTPEVARAQAAQVPGARFESVPAAAHLAPLERPRETLAHVTRFLDERRAA